jgi:hypothetical protein
MTTPRLRFHLDHEIDQSVCRWTSHQCESRAGVPANNHLKLGAVVGDRGEPTYIPPKTKGSRRTVPLPAATTNLLRNYLKRHPHCADPTAPLFPSVRLRPPQPTGEYC